MAGPQHSETRTDRLIEELLESQGFDLRRPPAGQVLTQHEYRSVTRLRDALASSSKPGAGHGVPECVVLQEGTEEPIAVFEGKAYFGDLAQAEAEAQRYGDALFVAGYAPLAIAVAGTNDARFEIKVQKRLRGRWVDVEYQRQPISWVPNEEQMLVARSSKHSADLRPTVPPSDVLQDRASEINALFRESGLKDEHRPAAVGAIMLALWQSRGDVRRKEQHILRDINQACEDAFKSAGKSTLAKSLTVDAANKKLAQRSIRICEILERLNIHNLSAEHDYLGALYEEFFRYTGGNTIGQYFTPRHITQLMAEMCEVSRDDVVLDVACGTGGFLIAGMERMQRTSKLSRKEVVKLVQTQLIGFEEESVTAALCVANMILRGDGTSGVHQADCFGTLPATSKATVSLMNPPFPHRKSDTPPEDFVDKALSLLEVRGRAASLIPSSLLGKGGAAKQWREAVLKDNTLEAVITLPNELFEPYASATTAIVLMKKGIPHPPDRPVGFVRISNDGYRLRKGARLPVGDSELPKMFEVLYARTDIDGFSGFSIVEDADWAPGRYIPMSPLKGQELKDQVEYLLRERVAAHTRHAPQIHTLRALSESGQVAIEPYQGRGDRPGKRRRQDGKTISALFEVSYGYSALENKAQYEPGPVPVISSAASDNGIYGFLDINYAIRGPIVTAPRTGSLGEARVHEIPVAPTSDSLVLVPRDGTPREAAYLAAAAIRAEMWRFDYSRKLTPSRIAGIKVPLTPKLEDWVAQRINETNELIANIEATFND